MVDVKAQNIAFTTTDITAPADKTFQIKFDNEDASVQHNVEIKDSTGKAVFKGDLVTGVDHDDVHGAGTPGGHLPLPVHGPPEHDGDAHGQVGDPAAGRSTGHGR